jgi:glycosyltransferase involved in cell wall biosynthesis
MIYNGISEGKCVISPYGVDTSIFKPRASVPSKPRFISVGAICLRKGHQYLLRAFEQVRKALPDAELICAGSYYPDFRLERKRWEGTFTHVEGLPQVELAKLLNQATAFVLPSNEESIARSIIEAMGAGLPIIGTYESGAPTLVEDGVHGYIVKARNVDQLAQAMLKLARDPALCQKMGEAAYARGAAKNSWGDYADRLIRIVSDAIAARQR